MRLSKLNLVILLLIAGLLVSCADNSDSKPAASSGSNTKTVVNSTSDTAVGADSLLGSWVQTNNSSRFAIVKKTSSGYTWEDNEGKYSAVFKDGSLKIETGLGQAVAFYDEETKQMIASYMGSQIKFQKRTEESHPLYGEYSGETKYTNGSIGKVVIAINPDNTFQETETITDKQGKTEVKIVKGKYRMSSSYIDLFYESGNPYFTVKIESGKLKHSSTGQEWVKIK